MSGNCQKGDIENCVETRGSSLLKGNWRILHSISAEIVKKSCMTAEIRQLACVEAPV